MFIPSVYDHDHNHNILQKNVDSITLVKGDDGDDSIDDVDEQPSSPSGISIRDDHRTASQGHDENNHVPDGDDAGKGTFCTFIHQTYKWDWRRNKPRSRLSSFTRREVIVLILISLAYLFATPARGHLNPLAGLIIASDNGLSYSVIRHGQILFVGAVAAAVGKVVTGFLIDIYDPLWCFFFCVLLSAIATLLISILDVVASPLGANVEGRHYVLQGLHAMNIFSQSGVYASGAKFIQIQFRPVQYGRALVFFAIGGRLGSIIGVLGMGVVVSYYAAHGGWQLGSRIASILCFAGLVPLLLLKLCYPQPVDHLVGPDNRNQRESSPSRGGVALLDRMTIRRDRIAQWKRSLLSCPVMCCSPVARKRHCIVFRTGLLRILSWCQRRSFLLMAMANAGMAVAIAPEGFDGFSALFTVQALNVNPGLSTGSVVIFIHIGAIVSLILGGIFVETFARRAQTRYVLGMVLLAVLATGALIALAHVGDSVPEQNLADGGRAVFFCIGLGLGYPYFVTVPKFALHFGGAHSGLVIQILSLFGLAVCAAADGVFGILAINVSWMIVAVLVCAFVSIAMVMLTIFDFLEWRAKYRLKQLNLQSALGQLVPARKRTRPRNRTTVRPKDMIQQYVSDLTKGTEPKEEMDPDDINSQSTTGNVRERSEMLGVKTTEENATSADDSVSNGINPSPQPVESAAMSNSGAHPVQPTTQEGAKPNQSNPNDDGRDVKRRMLHLEHASFVGDVAGLFEQHEKEMDMAEPNLYHRQRRRLARALWSCLSLVLALGVTVALFASYFLSRAAAVQQMS